jgi:hypothetical protein
MRRLRCSEAQMHSPMESLFICASTPSQFTCSSDVQRRKKKRSLQRTAPHSPARSPDALTPVVREYAGLHHTSVETVRSVEVHRS